MIVDSSVLVEVLLNTPHAARIGAKLLSARDGLDAPELLDVEVSSVLRRLARARAIDDHRAGQAIEALVAMPIQRHSHAHLMRRAWSLRANITAYDATYVVLAESLGATLLTRDTRLAAAASRHVRIEVA